MRNLYTQISHYSKDMNGITVYFMRIDTKFGYCFFLDENIYGNLITVKKKLSKENLDELTILLEGNAQKHVKTVQTIH